MNGLHQFYQMKNSAIVFTKRHLYLSVFVSLAAVTTIVYLPALTAYLISDDLTQVSFLYFNIADLLNGQKWDQWFLGIMDGYLYFRPATYALTLVDFVAWDQLAFGYHLTNVILHILSTFLVFLISLQWTRNQLTALATTLLFALLPSHAGAVSWVAAITDCLCGLLYFLSVLFFVLNRQRNKPIRYAISLGAFVFALASKEVAIMLPATLLLYDVSFNFSRNTFRLSDWVKRHAPFWIVLGLYLGFRFFVQGAFGYRGTQLTVQDVSIWVNGTLVKIVDPLINELSSESQWGLLAALVVIFLPYRSRPEVAFGLVWIPLTTLPTINSITNVSDRSFYIPSLGLCLVLASILTRPIERPGIWERAAGLLVLAFLSVGYGVSLVSTNLLYNQAGQVAEAIPQNVKALHPTFPPKARLVFVGVPDRLSEGPLIYLTGFGGTILMAYQNPTLLVYKYNKFPIWFDELDKTFFFEVNHRKVTERADLISALERRRQCADVSFSTIRWNFSNDAQGWEPWDQLSEYTVHDGALNMRSDGNDPYMASPLIDVPSIAIGDIEITMRARADKSEMQGKVYWLGTGQNDFSPALQMPFTVKADGEYHTYRVDISRSNQLVLDDHILRLRLDPADDQAEIGIKEIQVYSHCSETQGEYCKCSP